MLAHALLSLPLVALCASALQVTAPTNTSGWETSGSQVISWDSVSTDPSNFTIQLFPASSPNTATVVATDVETSSGTYTYTPSSSLAAGSGYRVNLVSDSGGILAQSDYFTVEEGTSSVSASASASGSASASMSSSASASKSSASASGSASGAASQTSGSSTSSSAAAASSSKSAANNLVAPGGVLLLVAGAVGLLA